jgi:hypothetical protein
VTSSAFAITSTKARDATHRAVVVAAGADDPGADLHPLGSNEPRSIDGGDHDAPLA